MPTIKQYKTTAISDGATTIHTVAGAKLVLDSIDISLTAGDVIVHRGAAAGTGNDIVKSETPGKVFYPDLLMSIGDVIALTGANSSAGTVIIGFRPT